MQYDGQSLQHISRYYFHAKTEGGKNYDTIETILILLIVTKWTVLQASLFISLVYVFNKIVVILHKMSKMEFTESDKLLTELLKEKNEKFNATIRMLSIIEKEEHKYDVEQKVYSIQLPPDSPILQTLNMIDNIKQLSDTEDDKKHFLIEAMQKQWRLYLISVIIINILVHVALVIFHILSIVQLIHYGVEVLTNGNPTFTVDAIISLLLWFALLGVLGIKLYTDYFSDGISLISVAATLVIVNLTYIAFYFMPYMLLAFIYGPIQTSVTYGALMLFVLCGYLFVSAQESSRICIIMRQSMFSRSLWKSTSRRHHKLLYKTCYKFIFHFAYSYASLVISVAAVFLLLVLTFILTLGSFDDFEAIQNLVLPLVIAIISYFIVKPAYKLATERLDVNSSNTVAHMNKLMNNSNIEYSNEQIMYN